MTPSPIVRRVNRVVRVVSRLLGVNHEFVLAPHGSRSGVRSKTVALARQVSYHLMRKRCRYSSVEMALAFNRDHTSVLSGCRHVEEMLVHDEQLRIVVAKAEAELDQDELSNVAEETS